MRVALRSLLQRETHPHFIGYLHLYKLSIKFRQQTDIQPNWNELGTYLKVVDGPEPHLRPFWAGRRKANQEWLNQNIAGSFSPSSLRSDGPFCNVVHPNNDGTFSLRRGHARLALRHLLLDEKIDAVYLSLFLHRDRGYVSESKPTCLDVLSCFRQDFGYPNSKEQYYSMLYSSETNYEDSDWFDEWDNSQV